MKALVAAACIAVIAAIGYYFIQEYRGHQAGVAAAKAADEAAQCRAAAYYKTQMPTYYELVRERCGI